MKKHLSEITKRMGLNTSELDINYNPTHLTAETTIDSMTIKVDPALTASISFKPAISLPEEYVFTANASYEETFRTAQCLKNAYPDIIGTTDPAINIHGGNYNIYLQKSYILNFLMQMGMILKRL